MSARLNLDEESEASNEIQGNRDISTKEDQQALVGAFAFPRGAHAGNFLHTLLEEIDFTALPDNLDELISDLLTRFSIELHWVDVVKVWLNDILNAPLMPTANQVPTENKVLTVNNGLGDADKTLSLSALSPKKKLVEMEFYFPVNKLNAHDFNHLLSQYPCLQAPVKPTDFRQLKGMLKGFVDLIFEWNGQYFILDYKSNFLGDNVQAYDQVATHLAMSEHRYDVQLVIYTLALHRLLQLRINDYNYDQHIGGAYYVFLRGMNALDNQNYYGQYFHKPDKALIESLDHLVKEELIHE
jgi:exodeoxyribonuclease V beta subunit